MTEATLERTAHKFNAFSLSRTWLAVAIASGNDERVPVLCRTMLVEFFDRGVQLVACDSYMVLTGWVPVGFGDERPDIDEAPNESVIAIDPHGRGAGLMGHLRKIAAEAAKDGIDVEATFSIGEPPKDPTDTLELDGLEARALIIDHPRREEVALPLFEGDYPNWRQLFHTHEAVATDEIALNPEIIGRVAKLGKLFEPPLRWTFGGENGPAYLEIGALEKIRGLAMPVRVNEDEAATEGGGE